MSYQLAGHFAPSSPVGQTTSYAQCMDIAATSGAGKWSSILIEPQQGTTYFNIINFALEAEALGLKTCSARTITCLSDQAQPLRGHATHGRP